MKHFLISLFLLLCVSSYGYEFVVSGSLVHQENENHKELLDARSMPTAVIHVITDIRGLKNSDEFCVSQEETEDGYYFYVVANEPVDLILSAPQFRPLEVSFSERLESNEVRRLDIMRTGNNPSEFELDWNDKVFLSFNCEEDPSNLASSFYEERRGAPQVWVYTDLSFNQVKPLFDKEVYELISDPEVSPYRLVIKTKEGDESFPFENLFVKKMKKDDSIKFLQPASDIQKGDILTPFTTYKLNIYW